MCTPYNRQRDGFTIQSISPSAIAMLENTSINTCLLPRDVNILSASEILQIRQTLSQCIIRPHVITPIDIATELAILQMKRNNYFFLSYSLGRGPGEGILDTNFGWDNDGVWFSGDATEITDYSYPIFTTFTIPPDKQVEVSVDFVYNDECSDFGLCFYQDDTVPEWQWESNITRIACQYDCELPYIYGLTTSISNDTGLLINGNTYTCHAIYDPNNNPTITLNTILNGTIVDTLTLDDQVLTSAYRIGFSADQDNMEFTPSDI